MTVYFVSDTHFGHANIIKYCNRPFQSVTEMNAKLVENWNKKIQKDDQVFHLGDVMFYRDPRDLKILNELNGNKHLIIGNHDNWRDLKPYFLSIEQYKEIEIGPEKQKLVLLHYPMWDWNRKKFRHEEREQPTVHKKGSIHIHGHCHGGSPYLKDRIDAGVDVHDYAPISYEDVMNIIQTVGGKNTAVK